MTTTTTTTTTTTAGTSPSSPNPRTLLASGSMTPSQQREHQRRAKEDCRARTGAMRAVERHGYLVQLARIAAGGDGGDGPWGYGKAEVLLGARRGSARRSEHTFDL